MNDFSRSRMQEELLGLSEKAKVATTSVANSNSTASEELSKFSVKPGKQVNDTAIPVKRSRKENPGGKVTVRLKPVNEKRRGKKVKKVQPCPFCGGDDHRIGKCDSRMKMGTVVTKEAINQTIMDISSGSLPLFLPVHPIQVRDHIYKQVPGDTNYVCVHNYATPESLLADWTGSKRADTICTCVTFVFPRAIMTEINTRCFICTIALVQWISRSLKKKSESLWRSLDKPFDLCWFATTPAQVCNC